MMNRGINDDKSSYEKWDENQEGYPQLCRNYDKYMRTMTGILIISVTQQEYVGSIEYKHREMS